MIQFLKSLFGFGPKINFQEVIINGGQIIDVRSKSEYQSGHIENAINIPLDNINNNIEKLNKNIPIITCCASGMRSESAKQISLSKGFKEVYNGGGWISLRNKI